MPQKVRLLPLLLLLAFASTGGAQTPKAKTPPDSPAIVLIDNPKTLETIQLVLDRVSEIRNIKPASPIKPSYLDSDTLRRLVERDFEKGLPEEKRIGVERFLKSLQLIPEDLNIMDMFLSLLDEQVGGLYDPETKHLFVRRNYDIVNSALARSILAHEICHFLQDQAFDLEKLGIDVTDDDDMVMALTTVLEGDAMLLLSEYAAYHEQNGILKDLPQALSMDQSALNETPHFFQQQLLFPYVQGQLLLQEALDKGKPWRDRLFTDPPMTTEQVLHPEKYFGERDEPSPLALETTGTARTRLLGDLADPVPPSGFKRLEVNRFGEFGVRLLFEERLGGISYGAAEGWDGDLYEIHSGEGDKWWFVWETVWDSPLDAREFQGAWVTYWRSLSGDRKLGDLKERKQEFKVREWTFQFERSGKRVILTWRNE